MWRSDCARLWCMLWDVLNTARSGVRDDETWSLMHLPMQAGFALAVPAAAAIAVLALANGVAGWWFAIVPPAGCAVWFGAVSAEHPGLVGSLGELTGLLAAGWGLVVAVALWATGFWATPARVARTPEPHPHGRGVARRQAALRRSTSSPRNRCAMRGCAVPAGASHARRHLRVSSSLGMWRPLARWLTAIAVLQPSGLSLVLRGGR